MSSEKLTLSTFSSEKVNFFVKQVCYFEGIKPGEHSHEQELEIPHRYVQFLALESLCGPSYEGLKVVTRGHGEARRRGDDYIRS